MGGPTLTVPLNDQIAVIEAAQQAPLTISHMLPGGTEAEVRRSLAAVKRTLLWLQSHEIAIRQAANAAKPIDESQANP